MKKLFYLLACLSLPLVCLFILLSMFARASAAPPTAALLPIRLDYGGRGIASLAAPDAKAKDAPLALAAEAALLTPRSSTAINLASALQQGDIAGEIISVTVTPDPTVAGCQATFVVKVRNDGNTPWDPSIVGVAIDIIDQRGTVVDTAYGSDAIPFEEVQPSSIIEIEAFFHVPHEFEGVYRYQASLVYDEQVLDTVGGAISITTRGDRYAQGKNGTMTTQVKGTIQDEETHRPVADAQITIEELGISTRSDTDGNFAFDSIVILEPILPVTVTVAAPGYGLWRLANVRLIADDTLILSVALRSGNTPTIRSMPIPSAEREEGCWLLEGQPLDLTPEMLGALLETPQTIPSTIRVGRQSSGWPDCQASEFTQVDVVGFKDYVKHVLPHEWINSWHPESLRAGAMAVKMYAWYWIVVGGKWATHNPPADVMDSTCDQVYNPAVSYDSTNDAVEDTWNYLMTKDGSVFQAHYCSWCNVCPFCNCGENCMGQNESKAKAEEGLNWQQILHHFYADIEVEPITAPRQAVDIVFAMDTSGSMDDEFNALCSKIDDVVTDLQSRGITVRYKILGITRNRQCTTDYVSNLIPGARSNHSEDWGPATYDLSYGYDWATGYVRMIIPMSDEGPENGNPCYDPGEDRDAISDAIAAAQANNVRVSPVLGSWYQSSQAACITQLAEDLANGTGGRVLYSTEPSADLANGIAELVQAAVKPDPKGEQEPSTLPPDFLRETNPWFGGDEDEVLLWTHEYIADLLELRTAYQNSIGDSVPITIPITRYYGETKPDHTLEDNVIQNVIKEAKLIICSWDVDPGENISLKINGTHAFYLEGEDRKWDCRSYSLLPDLTKLLWFPQNPGAPSDPTDPNSSPGTLNAENNTFIVTYSSDYKALIYGMRLIIKGVRPVVLVPGFVGDASSYEWGRVETVLTDTYGVIVERPCDYGHHKHWGVWLPEEHNRRCFERVHKEVPRTGILAINRVALRWTIDEIKKRYGVDKVNLVGHSKGGLFSRAYVEGPRYQWDVENLISISSPHGGVYLVDVATNMKDLPPCDESWWIDPICELGRSEWELIVNKLLSLFNFKPGDRAGKEISETWINEQQDNFNATHQPRLGVKYHSIVATAGRQEPGRQDELDPAFSIMKGVADPLSAFSFAYRLQYYSPHTPNRGQSDIAIPVLSQRMGSVDRRYEQPETGSTCNAIRANHEESSRSVFAALAVEKALGLVDNTSLLLSCDDIAPLPSQTAMQSSRQGVAAVVTETFHSLTFSGPITYGTAVDVPFVVDGSDLSVSGLWIGDATVFLELTDPASTLITPTMAIENDNIGYEELRESSSDFGYASYSITETVKGLWTAHIIAPDAGPASEAIWWQLLVSQRSPISFTVTTAPTIYPWGSSVTLHAHPVTGTVLITGANIQAEIRGETTGITQSVTLVDDGLHDDLAAGDGIYGGQFTPSQPDSFEALAIVTGTLPSGIAYMRQDRTYFTVLPSTAHFSDVYSDRGIDEDGDGLFDKLRIEVGITVDQNGEYTLIGSLSTPSGTEIGATSTAISATASSNVTTTLDFDASLLVNRSADGPVVLSKLLLMDQSVDLRTDHRENTYTTQSYSRLDFSGWEARMADSLSDQGVDTNGNGKFEYLEVQVPLEVRRAGTYTVTSLLELADGSRIRAPEVISDTLPGVNAFSFHFDGPTMALHATDGPYTVTNMLVEGPLGLALFQDTVGETASYSYLDFELDAVAPASFMTPLPPYTTTPTIELSWGAVDPSPSTGIAGYDVQYRVGPGGTWTDWLPGTVLTTYTFGPYDPVSVEFGQTYYFRVRAYDFAGNQETYRGGDGDAHVCVVSVYKVYLPLILKNYPPDTTPPAAVTNLSTSNPTLDSMTLNWTAPGDDGNTGTAWKYDARYSTSPITEANWNAAAQCAGEPAPQPAGNSETFTVNGLNPDTAYYFALKTADEVPNWSRLSNVASGATVHPDTTPPATVTNLATSNPTLDSITLNWTAPGDDGNTDTASEYDIRYSTSPIADANWNAAAQCVGEPAPQPAGSSETFTVHGLTPNNTYCFALKTADEVPHWSGLSNIASGTTLRPSDQLVINCGFETDEAWVFGESPRPAAYTTGDAHWGARSVRLGIKPPSTDAYSWSSVRQRITIPANAKSATLSFWYKPFTECTYRNNWQQFDWSDFSVDQPSRIPPDT